MGKVGIQLQMEPLRSLVFSDLLDTYSLGIGTSIDNPARMYEIHNLTNALLIFSLDGVSDHFPLPANSCKILDIVSNKTSDEGWYIPKGTRFYARYIAGTVPTSGTVYVAISYGN